MNYYEHHIGDFLKKTAHLSVLEEGAYRRLLDRYYIIEGPLPSDVRECCKLARAASKPERAAVSDVLREFFDLRDDGWHQKRADEEIARYMAKQPEAEAKKENDRERQRRARLRRKQLFDDLRNHGIVAPWDATTEQLQEALSRATNESGHAKRSAPVTQPVTRDNTATHSPDTNPQTPSRGENPPNPPPAAAAAATPLPDWLGADHWASWKRHRRAIRKPLTADAERLAIGALEQLRTEGYTPKQVIENAILQGWQGLYAPKASGAAPRPAARESTEEHNRRAFDEWLGNDDGRTVDA